MLGNSSTMELNLSTPLNEFERGIVTQAMGGGDSAINLFDSVWFVTSIISKYGERGTHNIKLRKVVLVLTPNQVEKDSIKTEMDKLSKRLEELDV